MVTIKSIGFSYESQQIMTIMTTIFYSQYFNTGLVLMISNANFKHTPLSFIPINNQYPDLTTDWYHEVGSAIIKTMWINSIMPILNIFILKSMKWAFQFLDSKKSMFSEIRQTKKVTI